MPSIHIGLTSRDQQVAFIEDAIKGPITEGCYRRIGFIKHNGSRTWRVLKSDMIAQQLFDTLASPELSEIVWTELKYVVKEKTTNAVKPKLTLAFLAARIQKIEESIATGDKIGDGS